jgi:hypothetical protein
MTVPYIIRAAVPRHPFILHPAELRSFYNPLCGWFYTDAAIDGYCYISMLPMPPLTATQKWL